MEVYPVRETSGVKIVELPPRLAGSSDSESIDDFLQGLFDGGAHRVLLDCTNAAYIDSAVLGSFVRAHMQFLNQGGRIALLRPSGRIRSILEFTKLIHVFDVYDEESAALQGLS